MTPDQHIHQTLDALGVYIQYTDLPDDRDGEYVHARRLIRLRRKMTHRLHRSVLAHECAHAVFGDVRSKFGPVNAKQERRADEWAALQLIGLTDYMRAELLHNAHDGAMAVELDVTVDIVHAYQRSLLVMGERTYLRPKMGAQQWEHSTVAERV